MPGRAWFASLVPLPVVVFAVSALRPGVAVDAPTPEVAQREPVVVAGCAGDALRSLDAAVTVARAARADRARRSAEWEALVYQALDACPDLLEPVFVGCEDEPCLLVATPGAASANALDLTWCPPIYERFRGEPPGTVFSRATCPDGTVVPLVAWLAPGFATAPPGTKEAEVERRVVFERVEEAGYAALCERAR